MKSHVLTGLVLLLPLAAANASFGTGHLVPVDAVTGATEPTGDRPAPRCIEVEAFSRIETTADLSFTFVQRAGKPTVEYTVADKSSPVPTITSKDGVLSLALADAAGHGRTGDLGITVYAAEAPDAIALGGRAIVHIADLRSDRSLTLQGRGHSRFDISHLACASFVAELGDTARIAWNKAEVKGKTILTLDGGSRLDGSYLNTLSLDATHNGTGTLHLATLRTEGSALLRSPSARLEVEHVDVDGKLSAAAEGTACISLPHVKAASLTAETAGQGSMTVGGQISATAQLSSNSPEPLDARRLRVDGRCIAEGSSPSSLLLDKKLKTTGNNP